MHFKKKYTISLCLLMLAHFIIYPAIVRADLNADLNSFWNDLGGSNNLTGPTAFKSQAASYYSLGNVRSRVPSRTSQFGSFTLPSVEAGCGGIDIHSGALSIISADELVQTAKSIMANAVGFAFDLALETLSPVLAESMKNLRDLQNRMNQFNINSCQSAVGIVGAVWPKTTLARDKICASLGTSQGVFTDYAAARHGCGTSVGQESVADEQTPESLPNPVNIAWHLLHGDDGGIGDFLASNEDLAELVMTMTGTVIINDGDVRAIRAVGSNDEILDIILTGSTTTGSTIQLLDCGTDTSECINPQFSSSTSLTEAASFRGRVGALIDSLRTKIRNEGAGALPPTIAEQALVNATSIPLYRILNVYAAYAGPVIDVESESLKDFVATDMALSYVRSLIEQSLLRAANSRYAGHPVIESWLRTMRDLQLQIHNRHILHQQQTSRAFDMVERVHFIEQHLASRQGFLIPASADRTTEE